MITLRLGDFVFTHRPYALGVVLHLTQLNKRVEVYVACCKPNRPAIEHRLCFVALTREDDFQDHLQEVDITSYDEAASDLRPLTPVETVATAGGNPVVDRLQKLSEAYKSYWRKCLPRR